MIEEKKLCAIAALHGREEKWGLSASDVIAVKNGHHFHRGWHIGWNWGGDGENPCFLDILSEHRMTNINAMRVFPDGDAERIEVPREFRLVGATPEEDERLEQEYLEHNRRAYTNLRERGLLPPSGENLASQEINEYLKTGGAQN